MDPSRIDTNAVMAAFLSAMDQVQVPPPIEQRDVKLVTALTLDRIIGLGHEGGAPVRLFANRLAEAMDEAHLALRHCKLEPNESMVDLAAYTGERDPFITVATAESEAYALHPAREDSMSETSDYLWDLFKLIQVWSPLRLFVARRQGAREGRILEERIASTVNAYGDYFYEGDRIFSLVLPTAGRDYSQVRVYGWRRSRGKLVALPPTPWPGTTRS